MPKRPKYTMRQVAKALLDSEGLHTRAARILGCNVSTVGRYVSRDEDLQALKEEIVESTFDLAEEKLRELIAKGNIAAVICLRFRFGIRGRLFRHMAQET